MDSNHALGVQSAASFRIDDEGLGPAGVMVPPAQVSAGPDPQGAPSEETEAASWQRDALTGVSAPDAIRTHTGRGLSALPPTGWATGAKLGKQGSNLHSPGSKPGMFPVTPSPTKKRRFEQRVGESNPCLQIESLAA